MASSEIEIVSESNDQKDSTQTSNEIAIVDVYSASAYGDFDKLRKFVEKDGASVSVPDASGYYALQWAALNNFADIVQYIINVYVIIIIFLGFSLEIWLICEIFV